MTIGLKTPSSYYIELITTFPPRPITNEVELVATQNRINYILDNVDLTQDDRDYLKVLATLVEDYEEPNEQLPILKGIQLVKALLEESNLQAKDLVFIFGSEANILDYLNGKIELSESQIESLATFFKISQSYFTK